MYITCWCDTKTGMIYDQLVREFTERGKTPPLGDSEPEQERTPEQSPAHDRSPASSEDYRAA